MAVKEQERFRLRNMKISRIDLVDRGANQDAHIMLAKRDGETPPAKPTAKPAPESNGSAPPPVKVDGSLAERIRQAMSQGGEEQPKSEPSPLGRNKGEQQRISRIRPADFELVEQNAQMMEWAIPEDKLPEGVEEATMTLLQGGDEAIFQWMIDPLAGPPVEGQAKSAPEAYAAMRAALTQGGAMDPASMLGGLPNQKKPANPGAGNGAPGGAPGRPQPQKTPLAKSTPGRRRALKALAAARRNNKRRMAEGKNPVVDGKEVSPASLSKAQASETVDNTLDLIVKGLVEVDVFNETATGADLRDILPTNLLAELTNQLSASKSAE